MLGKMEVCLANRDVKTRQIRAPGNPAEKISIVRLLSGTNERFLRGEYGIKGGWDGRLWSRR